ncbi:amidase [Pseudoxanthomonas mexicana]|uniref:amidase n=1 Tax=Pseudoxanthomonas mexicana TaxID=128785 RepID=UPI00398B61E0
MRRIALLVLFLALSAGCRQPAPPPAAGAQAPSDFLYAEMDIAQLQALMRSGELDSRTLTRAYLDRIAAIDQAGPRLGAVIEINPDAMKEAALRDVERKSQSVRGPLHGIPVLLKDNIDAVPMATSAGSLALKDLRPAGDAFLVRRLREAGAVVLGKTNLSEWANFRSTRSTSGWSARGGQTRNPYVLDRNPCGSSSGSAVAVSANLAAVAVGTETDGSILCPAAVNGLVGLKPTVGLISRGGILPIAHSQDTAGPMTRSVADAAVLLGVMAGRDSADVATQQAAWNMTPDYRERLRPDALKGARIGVLRSKSAIHPDAAAALEAALEVMREAGAVLVDAEIPTEGQWSEAELEVLLFEFKAGVERYLRGHDAPLTSLTQLIGFNQQFRSEEMPHFGQELFEMANTRGSLADPTYIAARSLARQLAGPEGIDAALKAQRLDALIAPTTGPAWPTDYAQGDRFPGAGYGAAAVAGYPSLTVPMGHSHGLPLGLTFMGPAWSEGRLLALGYAYEQMTRARKPPVYLPTLQIPQTPPLRQ